MRRNQFDAVLPATRCTAEMRDRVQAVADASSADKADVIRDSLEVSLVHMELALGLKGLDDYEDEALEIAGLQSALRQREQQRHGEKVAEALKNIEDRTRGLAWGTPVEPEPRQQ